MSNPGQQEDGLICAFLRDESGRWSPISWDAVRSWQPDQGLIWIHLDANHDQARQYLTQNSGIDALDIEALLEPETRPRVSQSPQRLLAMLRGVNLNPGADTEDMVSIRIWADSQRLVTTRRRRLMAAQDLCQALTDSKDKDSIGRVLTDLIAFLVHRMSGAITDLDDRIDTLEDEVLAAESRALRTELGLLRRQAISLRRYIAPQRDALQQLLGDPPDWFDRRSLARLREIHERIIRYVEDLDSARDRAAVIQDELMNRLSDHMNRNMYLLTIVATVMLPLGFLTGLLGINVDGIPGSSDSPWAFTFVCIGLGVLVTLEIWLFRKMRWL